MAAALFQRFARIGRQDLAARRLNLVAPPSASVFTRLTFTKRDCDFSGPRTPESKPFPPPTPQIPPSTPPTPQIPHSTPPTPQIPPSTPSKPTAVGYFAGLGNVTSVLGFEEFKAFADGITAMCNSAEKIIDSYISLSPLIDQDMIDMEEKMRLMQIEINNLKKELDKKDHKLTLFHRKREFFEIKNAVKFKTQNMYFERRLWEAEQAFKKLQEELENLEKKCG